jgi:nitronate monooxygenase
MDLRDLLGIDHRIIQAPMAGVQDSALAIAVANAGGLGSLPCAMLSPDEIRCQVSAIAEHARGPCNLNFFCHRPAHYDEARELAWRRRLQPFYHELGVDPGSMVPAGGREPFNQSALELVEELRPPVVSFHFGLPADELLARVKATGAKVLASATTVAEALWLEARGIDAIIAQGLEAGGHRGMFLGAGNKALVDQLDSQMGTLALVRQVVQRVALPVIAAGGIADAAGVAAAIALGAAGVQSGTAYLLCPEAKTSAVHRAALSSDAAADTAITNLFTGRPARAIVNRLLRELGPRDSTLPDFPLPAGALAPLRAGAQGNQLADFAPLWCGQYAGCQAVPAAEVTRRLAAGLH